MFHFTHSDEEIIREVKGCDLCYVGKDKYVYTLTGCRMTRVGDQSNPAHKSLFLITFTLDEETEHYHAVRYHVVTDLETWHPVWFDDNGHRPSHLNMDWDKRYNDCLAKMTTNDLTKIRIFIGVWLNRSNERE